MHIVIVGAGGIGGYYGARLVAAGERVSFVARGRHGQAIREHGLRVTSPLGDVSVRPHAVSDDGQGLEPADLVVFAVKLPDAESAARTTLPPLVRSMRPGAVVLPLQNGVEVAELLAQAVGAAAVALGVAYIATKIAAPGLIEHGGPMTRLRFGPLQPAQQPALAAFEAACRRAGIDVELLADPRRAMWEKFILLVAMSSLTTLTRCPAGVVRSLPETRALLQQVMDEAAALARAEGVDLGAEFVARQMAFVDGLPPGMKASMLHDLEAGRPLELPWLAGAVARRSERLGLAAPASGFIVAALAPFVGGARP